MKEWTQEEEAANLKRLLSEVGNKAQFAKDNHVPGGASMLSQHQSGHRPIGLEAGLIYAKAPGVTLAEISPRLAKMVEDVPKLTGSLEFVKSNVEPALELKKSKKVPITGSVRGGDDGYLVQSVVPDGWVEYWTGDPMPMPYASKATPCTPATALGSLWSSPPASRPNQAATWS